MLAHHFIWLSLYPDKPLNSHLWLCRSVYLHDSHSSLNRQPIQMSSSIFYHTTVKSRMYCIVLWGSLEGVMQKKRCPCLSVCTIVNSCLFLFMQIPSDVLNCAVREENFWKRWRVSAVNSARLSWPWYLDIVWEEVKSNVPVKVLAGVMMISAAFSDRMIACTAWLHAIDSFAPYSVTPSVHRAFLLSDIITLLKWIWTNSVKLTGLGTKSGPERWIECNGGFLFFFS